MHSRFQEVTPSGLLLEVVLDKFESNFGNINHE
jgi:hypothetical protein